MLGITMAGNARKLLGLGDQIQLTSFPENYFRNTGEKVIDLDGNFLFDHNPYVLRNINPSNILDIWTMTDPSITKYNYNLKKWIPSLSEKNLHFAEKILNIKLKCFLRHPRLYKFEDNEINPNKIVVHLTGISTGECPDFVAKQILNNYKNFDIHQIGYSTDKLYEGFIDSRGLNFWESAKLISESLIFIGVSSSMMNLAFCYPRTIKKIIITESDENRISVMDNMMPMDPENGHYHWLDWSFCFYNKTQEDVGVSYSYLKI
jgi:hypothetical protein